MIEENKIKSVKASGTNGKKPALYREYWILEKLKDYSYDIEEIKYTFSTMFSVDYYLTHPYALILSRQSGLEKLNTKNILSGRK